LNILLEKAETLCDSTHGNSSDRLGDIGYFFLFYLGASFPIEEAIHER